jgi:feruloyl esterase
MAKTISETTMTRTPSAARRTARPHPLRFSLPRTFALLPITAVMLAACGGSDDDNTGTPDTSAPPALVQNAQTCAALGGTAIPASAIGEPTTGAVVTSASLVSAVPQTLNAAGTAVTAALPEYCRVLVDIKPVDSSAPLIKAQVNLPTIWNGKSMQLGGGGYNGSLVTGLGGEANQPPSAPLPLTRGYATLGTDSGHQNATGVEAFAFALNDEALTNFAYASYKKTRDVGVRLMTAYYGKPATRSYYMGSSEGGREGMMMAQRYPQDFDGVLSLYPVLNWSGLQTFGNNVGGILQKDPGAWLGTKVKLINDTVLAACDSLDGIADRVVSNYLGCKAPADAALAALRCPSGNDEGPSCLSTAQLAVVNAAHTGYTFSFPLANGVTAYPGFGYGNEANPANWPTWMTGTVAPNFTAAPNPAGIGNLFNFGNGYVRYFIAKDPNFNPLTYNPTNFRARVEQVSALMDATNPDLSAFRARGGKLILRENVSDTAQSPFAGLRYFDSVNARMGEANVATFMRTYVTPGIGHTGSEVPAGTVEAPAYGIPAAIDWVSLLEKWVEGGQAPADQLVQTIEQRVPPFTVTASKPLCRYPLYPKYVGTSPAGGNLASNYVCSAS